MCSVRKKRKKRSDKNKRAIGTVTVIGWVAPQSTRTPSLFLGCYLLIIASFENEKWLTLSALQHSDIFKINFLHWLKHPVHLYHSVLRQSTTKGETSLAVQQQSEASETWQQNYVYTPGEKLHSKQENTGCNFIYNEWDEKLHKTFLCHILFYFLNLYFTR